MRSSEQVAFDALKELSAPDRRLVEAWHDLGNDWVTSLVNSGVLGRTHRTHPSDIQADTFESALEDRSRRLQVGPQRARRKAAEHEAAHATVAEALGYRVHEVVIGDHGSGHVEYEQASRKDTAVIAVAGGLWITAFRSAQYPEGDAGCGQDDRALAVAADQFDGRQATAQATQILREHRAAVLALADRVERDGRAVL
jgi:hypothetical protein